MSENNINKTILGIGLIVSLIGTSVIIVNELSKPSVKGVSTTISPTPTTTPTPTSTPSPTPTIKPVSVQKQPSLQTKQYGGWYWRPDLGRAQVFIGSDSAGKDIWTDGFPTPTPTPTPKPATQQLSTQGTFSNTSGTSSTNKASMTQEVKVLNKYSWSTIPS